MRQGRPRTGSDNRIKSRTGEPGPAQTGLDRLRDVLFPLTGRQVGQHAHGDGRNATARLAQPLDFPRVLHRPSGLDHVQGRQEPVAIATLAAARAAVSHRWRCTVRCPASTPTGAGSAAMSSAKRLVVGLLHHDQVAASRRPSAPPPPRRSGDR